MTQIKTTLILRFGTTFGFISKRLHASRMRRICKKQRNHTNHKTLNCFTKPVTPRFRDYFFCWSMPVKLTSIQNKAFHIFSYLSWHATRIKEKKPKFLSYQRPYQTRATVLLDCLIPTKRAGSAKRVPLISFPESDGEGAIILFKPVSPDGYIVTKLLPTSGKLKLWHQTPWCFAHLVVASEMSKGCWVWGSVSTPEITVASSPLNTGYELPIGHCI